MRQGIQSESPRRKREETRRTRNQKETPRPKEKGARVTGAWERFALFRSRRELGVDAA